MPKPFGNAVRVESIPDKRFAGEFHALANDAGYIVHEGCDHIFFVGFLGAGKSTLARNLGSLFHRPSVDTDRIAERLLGKPIARVFTEDGEAAFREAETRGLATLLARKSLLVSCGGGIVETGRNVELMHQMGTIVYLDGDLSDSLRQIKNTMRRPDLGDARQAERLYWHRRPLYEQAADIRVDIRNKSFEQVALESGQLLWEKGLL